MFPFSTKATSRFHTPFIIATNKKLCQAKERLIKVCNEAWNEFLEWVLFTFNHYSLLILLNIPTQVFKYEYMANSLPWLFNTFDCCRTMWHAFLILKYISVVNSLSLRLITWTTFFYNTTDTKMGYNIMKGNYQPVMIFKLFFLIIKLYESID